MPQCTAISHDEVSHCWWLDMLASYDRLSADDVFAWDTLKKYFFSPWYSISYILILPPWCSSASTDRSLAVIHPGDQPASCCRQPLSSSIYDRQLIDELIDVYVFDLPQSSSDALMPCRLRKICSFGWLYIVNRRLPRLYPSCCCTSRNPLKLRVYSMSPMPAVECYLPFIFSALLRHWRFHWCQPMTLSTQRS